MTGLVLMVVVWLGAATADPDGAFGGYHDLPMPEQEIVLTGAYVPPWAQELGAEQVSAACVD